MFHVFFPLVRPLFDRWPVTVDANNSSEVGLALVTLNVIRRREAQLAAAP
jgi:hypothetical protein